MMAQLFALAYHHYRDDDVFDSIRFELSHRMLVSPLLDRTPSAVIPKHANWLSHVVFALPDVPTQIERLKKTLSAYWNQFPPCRNAIQESLLLDQWEHNQCTSTRSSLRLPTLVFMISREMTSEQETLSMRSTLRQAETELEGRIVSVLSPQSRSCFSKVEICIVSLPRSLNTYRTGSRMLFERMFQGKCARGGSHALYIEPDARPIKPGWLSSLAASIIAPNPHTWIVGSIFQGERNFPIDHFTVTWYFHFNGNGIYELPKQPEEEEESADLPSGMRDFAEYYFERVRPYCVEEKTIETSMDMDVMDFAFQMFKDRHLDKASVKRFVELVRYSPFITNQYHSNWSRATLREDIVMVHGGTQVQD